MSKREKPVISFTLDEEVIKKIEDYQFKNRINSRSKAAAELIMIGLQTIEDKEKDREEVHPDEVIDVMMDMLMKMKEKKEGV